MMFADKLIIVLRIWPEGSRHENNKDLSSIEGSLVLIQLNL